MASSTCVYKMHVCNSLTEDRNRFSRVSGSSPAPPLTAHREAAKVLTIILLKLIEENAMKEAFAGARSQRPIARKRTCNAAWGQNKNSGPLSQFTSVIETTGISLNHEIVICSASATSNERRRPSRSRQTYLLIMRQNLHKQLRWRRQRARGHCLGLTPSHHDQ